jgi:hypothetical protein
VRGKGKLHLHVISYGQDDAGKTVQLVKPGEAAEGLHVMYEENEAATARVKVKNARATEQDVTLVAILYADLDLTREVQRGALTLPAGGEGNWAVRYNVGPETYGRALEIKVLDESGTEIDRWQEYYQVAKEWLRV